MGEGRQVRGMAEQIDAPAVESPLAQAKDRYSAPALEKGLDILELFAREKDGLIQSEVGRRLHRTTSEVFRMLAVLERRGYIAQGPDERYRLTLRLFELAQQYPPTRRLTREAVPVMHEVAERTGQSCHLGVVDDGAVVILAQADAPVSMGFAVKAGSHIDLLSAASGYVILAFGNGSLREQILERARARGSRVPSDLANHLARIRRTGFEERKSYQVEGVVNISFPVLDQHGEAMAALTIPFLPRLDQSMAREEALSALRAGAAALSRAMGYTGQWSGDAPAGPGEGSGRSS
jgi:DNA-binding IclR family transcriptional regulator